MAAYAFVVRVELRRESGKFAARDELVTAITEQLEQAAEEGVSGVGADGDSEYVADDVSVEEYVPPKATR